jgi:hypothetical protein
MYANAADSTIARTTKKIAVALHEHLFNADVNPEATPSRCFNRDSLLTDVEFSFIPPPPPPGSSSARWWCRRKGVSAEEVDVVAVCGLWPLLEDEVPKCWGWL